jgi:hypothetical protein
LSLKPSLAAQVPPSLLCTLISSDALDGVDQLARAGWHWLTTDVLEYAVQRDPRVVALPSVVIGGWLTPRLARVAVDADGRVLAALPPSLAADGYPRLQLAAVRSHRAALRAVPPALRSLQMVALAALGDADRLLHAAFLDVVCGGHAAGSGNGNGDGNASSRPNSQ